MTSKEAILKEKLKTNIILLDYQHESILDLFEKFDSEKINKNNFYSCLIDISNYLYSHFKTEEDIMKYIMYPYYQEHLEEHNIFRKEFNSILEKAVESADFISLNKDLRKFLDRWKLSHYMSQNNVDDKDLRLVLYIRQQIKY